MPSKEDYITQIEGDLETLTEDDEVLKERLRRVEAASDDASAKKAYFDHIDEVNNPQAE